MDVFQILGTAGIILVAGIIQSSVGFAYALFATPVLLWLGIPLPHAITLVAFCSLVQSLLGARHLREEVPWKLSLAAFSLRIPSVLIGLFVLKRLMTLSVADIKFTVGCILCVLVIAQSIGRFKPKDTIHWFWAFLAFVGSGLLAGVCGMGGPPLVFWAMAHTWSVRKTRGFLFLVFALSLPVQLILLWTAFGNGILRTLAWSLLLIPMVWLGSLVGLPLGNRIPKPILRQIVSWILLVIGLTSVIPWILAHWR